jgi:uncharacterized protein
MPQKKPPELTAPKGSRTPLHLQAKGIPASSAKLRQSGRKWAAQSRAPLKKQDSSDAWNERQNRLAAARDSVRSHLLASYKRGAGDTDREPLKPGWRR